MTPVYQQQLQVMESITPDEILTTDVSLISKDSNPDIIDIYFGEMGSYHTLSKPEEVVLAKAIEEYSTEFLYRISILPIIGETVIRWETECREKTRKWDETFKVKTIIDNGVIRKLLPSDRIKLLNRIKQELIKLSNLEVTSFEDSAHKELLYKFHRTRIAGIFRDLDPSSEALNEIRLEFKRKILDIQKGNQEWVNIQHYEFSEALQDFEEIEESYDRMMAEKNKLIKANLRLVVSVGKRFLKRGLPFSDILQEGNLGLIKAVDKFDHRKGYRFSTYATWWIQQSIIRAIAENSRTIRIPLYISETVSKINKIKNNLQHSIGREPSLKEISDSAQISSDTIQFYLNVLKVPYSLEAPLNDEDDSNLGDIIADERAMNPFDIAEKLDLKVLIEDVLEIIPERERIIIKMRFGIDSQKEYTLEEIGNLLGLTRERIRQIEFEAIQKMKCPENNKHFSRLSI
jgi:RNA polymerase primary sigma factor